MPPNNNLKKRTSADANADDDNGTPSKHFKAEHPEDFSKQVKTKLKNSTRTGQACDRCKIRKIRCDGLAGGCSPCLQNNNECRTTDRITGRATSRGQLENLEDQNKSLKHRVQELEERLMHLARDEKALNGYHNGGPSTYEAGHAVVPASTTTWNPVSAPYRPPTASHGTAQQQETNMFKAIPAFPTGPTPENKFLGVVGNKNWSPIKGTSLAILGMEIDIADFDDVDMDEPDPSVFHPELYNKSYQAFLQTSLNINPRVEQDKVELPSRKEGLIYAEWYFRVLNPYLPLLHKPTFMKLLHNWYDDPNFQATSAETVLVHMVFAILFFQYAARNREDAVQQTKFCHLSNMHYHHSLGLYYQLICSRTLQDVQALTLICAHLRNFPKPGASWILARNTMSAAIEIGLHRSPTPKKGDPDVGWSPLESEMRKRVFWCLLTIHTTLSGKLGRPMPLRHEEYDTEIPEPVEDDALTESGLDPSSTPDKCLHKVGLEAFKLVPLFMEMYSTIYAVRKDPSRYCSTITSLESRLRDWKEKIPAELTNGESGQNEQEGAVFALYTQSFCLEFRLLLRHPSVLMTNDKVFNAESMRICVESSRQMLSVVRQLQRYKSLDTTWYNTAVYAMAITTTLCSQYEKRTEVSPADFSALKEEMDLWLDIMGDVGKMLGSGDRLRAAIQRVSETTLDLIAKAMPPRHSAPVQNASKGNPEAPKVSPIRTGPPATPATTYPSTNHSYVFQSRASTNGPAPSSTYITTNNHISHQETPYPSSTQYAPYPDNTPSAAITYTLQENSHRYSNYNTGGPGVRGPLTSPMTVSQPQNHPSSISAWQHASNHNTGSQAWQDWTDTITESAIGPPEPYTANSFSITRRDMVNDDGSGRSAHTANGIGHLADSVQSEVPMDHNQNLGHLGAQWPNLIFDIGNGAA